MTFCQNCGKEAPLCVCENATDNVQAMPNLSEGVENQGSVQSTNQLLQEALIIGKKFFSKKPTDALTLAIKSKTNIFIVFSALYILMTTLAWVIIPKQIFTNLISSVLGGFAGLLGAGELDSPIGSTLVTGLITAIFSIGITVGLIKAIHAFFKQEVSMTTILNMVSVAILPATAAALAGILFVYIHVGLSLLFLLVGSMMSTLVTYIGMQKEAKFTVSPLWCFAGMYAVKTIVLYYLSIQISF